MSTVFVMARSAEGVDVAVVTVMVLDAVLFPVFESVDDDDSPAVAVFVTVVPTAAFTIAWITSVAVEFALISPIAQVPVELA